MNSNEIIKVNGIEMVWSSRMMLSYRAFPIRYSMDFRCKV